MNQEKDKNPQFSPRDMQRVIGSPEGKELLAILAGSGGLQKAMEAFRKGDMDGVRSALEPAMTSEKAEVLLKKLNGSR